MEKQLDKLEGKVDQVLEQISEIKVVQAEQAVDLKYHIKRTNDLQLIVEPLHKKHMVAEGIFKVIGVIASFCAFVLGILELINKWQ